MAQTGTDLNSNKQSTGFRVTASMTGAMYSRFRVECKKLGMKESEFIRYLFGKHIENKNADELSALLDNM